MMILSFFVLLLSIPSAAQKKDKDKDKAYYHEDLYILRPKFEAPTIDTTAAVAARKFDVVPVKTVNAKVNGVLDSINAFTTGRKFIDGYTIQIYSGQNRDDAMNTKKRMVTDIPELNAILEYNQPKFRVRAGNYFSRLEAQKDLVRLRRAFPNAILVPEKIQVR